MSKKKIKLDLPLCVGYMVYQYAKLKMLEFYYDFLDIFIDRRHFQLIEMDTVSLPWMKSWNQRNGESFMKSGPNGSLLKPVMIITLTLSTPGAVDKTGNLQKNVAWSGNSLTRGPLACTTVKSSEVKVGTAQTRSSWHCQKINVTEKNQQILQKGGFSACSFSTFASPCYCTVGW